MKYQLKIAVLMLLTAIAGFITWRLWIDNTQQIGLLWTIAGPSAFLFGLGAITGAVWTHEGGGRAT